MGKRKSGRYRIFLFFLALLLAVSAFGCGYDRQRSADELREMIEEGRQAEVVPQIEALLDQTPDDIDLNRLYGLTLISSGRPSLAIWPLTKVVESEEALPEDGVILASAHLQGGSPDDAIVRASQILEEYPDLLEALYVRITANRRLNREAEALRDIDFILERRPDDFNALTTRIELLLDLELTEEIRPAVEAAKEVAAENEVSPEWAEKFCMFEASFTYENQEEGSLEKATELWDECLSEFPSSPRVVFAAIDFNDGEGRFLRSMKILEEAIELDAEEIDFVFELSSRLSATGADERASEVIAAIPEESWKGTVGLRLVDYYVGADDYPTAVAVFTSVVEKAKRVSESLQMQYVDLLIRAGELEAAETEITKLKKEEFVNLLSGRLALDRGEPEQAVAFLDAALVHWPGNSVARQLVGEAREQMGDFEGAHLQYIEAARNGSDNLEVLQKLDRVHRSVRDPGAMAQLIGAYIKHQPENPMGYELAVKNALWRGHVQAAFQWAKAAGNVPGLLPDGVALVATVYAVESPKRAIEFVAASEISLDRPSGFKPLEVMVDNLLILGRSDLALKRIDRAIQVSPGFAGFYELKARALSKAGSEKPRVEIREALEKAISLEPESSSSLLALADLTAEEGQIDAALALYDQAAELDWLDPEAEWRAIKMLDRAGREIEVDDRLEKLVAHHGEYGVATAFLAQRILDRNGDLGRAKSLAHQSIRFGSSVNGKETLELIESQEGDSEASS